VPRNETICTECDQSIGVSRDWNRQQKGQVGGWKVARHRRERSRVHLAVRIPMCLGSGFIVSDAVVWSGPRRCRREPGLLVPTSSPGRSARPLYGSIHLFHWPFRSIQRWEDEMLRNELAEATEHATEV
jgi:hypothetical protein